MSQHREPLITGKMVGLFIAFGADLILLVVLLAAVGALGFWIAGAITAIVLVVFGAWVGVRWYHRRVELAESKNEASEDDPLETLKQRYASGELSDDEFEEKVDALMDSSRRVEADESLETE